MILKQLGIWQKKLFDEFSEKFLKNCEMLRRDNSDAASAELFEFVAARDRVTSLLEEYTSVLKSKQFILLMEKENTSEVLPQQSTLRRFNQSTYSDFLTKYSKIQKYTIQSLMKYLVDKNDLKEFAITDISQLWAHQVTSRVNTMSVGSQEIYQTKTDTDQSSKINRRFF